MLIPIIIGAVIAFIALTAIMLAVFFRRVVPTNMVHIVQTSNKTTPFGRGKEAGNTYYAWPSWVPVIGVSVIEFPESIFQVSLQDYEAYDQARLPFVVDVTAFFRIEQAEKAAQRVASFHELNNQLQNVLQGAVRRILATNSLEEIMQSRSALGDQFTQEVKEQIAEWGVLPVKTIEFMDLRDSAKGVVIANIMAKEQSRIEMESRISVAENKRSAQLAEIDAQRTVEVQKQDAEQQVGLRVAEKDKTVGIANEQAQQEIKSAAKLTAERDMDVRKVNEVRQAEIDRDVAVVVADQNKQVAVKNAEASKEATVVTAEGDLQAAMKDAEGIRARGEANAAAEQAMLLAPVEAQLRLAAEIGNNHAYQQYLVTIRQVEAGRDVGLEMARAMQNADLKVIANGGDMTSGVSKLGDMFSPTGGTQLTGMLAALSQTPEGKNLVDALSSRLHSNVTAGALVGAATGNTAAGALVGMATGEKVVHDVTGMGDIPADNGHNQ